MGNFSARFKQFLRDEEGASALEYALMAAMVAVVVVSFIPDVQSSVRTIFESIKSGLGDATKPAP